MRSIVFRLCLILVVGLLVQFPAKLDAQTETCAPGLFIYELESGDYIENVVDGSYTYCFEASAYEVWRLDAAATDMLFIDFYRPGAYQAGSGFFAELTTPPGGNETPVVVSTAIFTPEAGVYHLDVEEFAPGEVLFSLHLVKLEARDGLLQNVDYLDANGNNSVGNYYWYYGNIEQALDFYLLASDLNPSDYYIWGNACAAAFQLGDYEEAIDLCDESLDIQPNYTVALDYRALAFESLGDYEEAIEGYEFLAEFDPQPGWHYNLGFAYTFVGDAEQALEHMQAYTELSEDWFDLFWRGLAYLNAGEYEEAIEDLEAVIAQPEDISAFYHLWLSLAYQLNGDLQEAETAFDAAIVMIEGEESEFIQWRLQAVVALLLGDQDEARDRYEEVLGRQPLPHQRRSDLLYLTVLAAQFPDEAQYLETLEWFREELNLD
ncbi:MAG: tetratricopeptide repeat protein [Chloroflexi bacterium]|nr:tetratricopeptide repeat protein [Chloroflexota bacterium]